MNHTTLGLVAVIAAAALVIGTFATTTIASSPAFADSSKTVTKQSNKQKLHQDGIINLADQDASNCIGVANTGGNTCRIQGTGP
jgi:hypothetical protein